MSDNVVEVGEHQNPYGGTCPMVDALRVSPRRAVCIECDARLVIPATRVFGPDPDAPSRRLDNFQADIDNLNITGREADSSSGPAAPTAG